MLIKFINDKGEQFLYSNMDNIEIFPVTKEFLDSDNYHKYWIIGETKSLQPQFKLIKLLRLQELQYRIVIDDFVKVYLMNDEGKTIERIN